ncbi:hypothetical protein I203_103661 [Kwoniella mangroviensis CBS 8507]|uniref:uncharacterized protein n=1 Tax=Kwoniella mangroviensis CBS 8507 TaxID=1296122 RepID=UPI003036C622
MSAPTHPSTDRPVRPKPKVSSSEKVYACSHCSKAYARRDYLERHALNHERPACVCSVCGKSFARPDVLRKHQSTTCNSGNDEGSREGDSLSSSPPLQHVKAKKRKRSSRTVSYVPDEMAKTVDDEGAIVQELASWQQDVKDGRSTSFHIHPTDHPTQMNLAHQWSIPNGSQDDNIVDNTLAPMTTSTEIHVDLPDSAQEDTTIIAGEEFNWNDAVPEQGQTGDNMDDLLSWLFNPATDNDILSSSTIPLDNEPLFEDLQNKGHDDDLHPDETDLEVRSDLGYQSNINIIPTLSQRPPSRMRSTYPENYIPHVPPPVSSHNIYPDLSESWSSYRPWRVPPKMEIVNEEARASMFDLFGNTARQDLMSPSFSLQQMRLHLELYFMHFAPLYPIVHEASLPYRKLPPDLLLAMICVGTAFANDPEGLEMASKVHKHLRTRVFDMVEDQPTASVSSLQTILLLNHFARSFCSLKQHDVAQIFHSPIINLARQSGMLLPNFDRKLQNSLDDPMACWLEWVAEEERKRLGWFSFMMDTENAALYRGFLLIHCYLIQIDVPCSDEVWQSSNPLEWNTALTQSVRPPSFRSLLRDLAGRGYIAPGLTKLVLWILLHGLHCVQWTLLWRDLGDLSMVHVSKITNWKDSCRKAFDTWRTYVDDNFGMSNPSLKATPLLSRPEHPMLSAGIPFSHLGAVLLLSDTEQIRIFAGTKKIAGRPISPGEWAAANVYVNSWAKSQDGAYCCFAALRLLAHVFRWSSETKFQRTSMVPWCVYLAALVIWSYSSALEGHDPLLAPFILITLGSSNSNPLVRIEPSLAQRSAIDYLDDLLSVDHPFSLPSIKDKNRCAGVVAYTAYLAGTLKRGVMEECRAVLLGLLTEHV